MERSLSESTYNPNKDYILSFKNIVTLVNLTLNVTQPLILRLIYMDTNTLGFFPGNVTERIVAINFAHIESENKRRTNLTSSETLQLHLFSDILFFIFHIFLLSYYINIQYPLKFSFFIDTVKPLCTECYDNQL